MQDFWPACGHALLERDSHGWLRPTDAWLRTFLSRPELALVDESCRAERALHRRLLQTPARAVPATELAALHDADARENYRVFIAFRDALLAAGTLEAWTLKLFRSRQIATAPLFIDLVVQAIVRGLLDDSNDAIEARAAELLFRPQRIAVQDGVLLTGDRDRLDEQNQTQGLGDLGRLLAEAKINARPLDLKVLTPELSAAYWADASQPRTAGGSRFLLDLRHESTIDVGHGLLFTTTRSRSGLKSLSRVLERWVRHLLGVTVTIEPVSRIDDAQWRWHLGLDADSSVLLDDLYEGREVEPERLKRLVSLFRLRFDNPAEMRADVAGKPVYLALMANTEQLLRLKPQNLLLNLPLAGQS